MVIDGKDPEIYREIENHRSELLRNTDAITFTEHGAGSSLSNNLNRKISTIAKNALSSPYQCRVMNRLVTFLKARNVLELGTSLGISSAYLAASESPPTVYTLEGDEESYKLASAFFDSCNFKTINPILGKFSDTLLPTLEKLKNIDITFIDGHHNKDATLTYYDIITKYCNNKSVIIVDDIYWSKGMNEAWEILKKRLEVSMTIDLFFCGIVFFQGHGNQNKHIKIRPDKILFHK